MATQPMGEANHQQLWEDALSKIYNLSGATVKRNAFLEARVAELEMRVAELDMDVAVYQRAHTVEVEASERQAKAHQTQVSTLNKQISQQDLFENQTPFILCVINGDQKLFHGSLLVQGRQGGIVAAQKLTQTIATHLSTEDLLIFGRISFWITVYFNRAHLLDTLVVNNICSVQQFDAFLGGFSQCSPRFSLVDVGYGLDGTDMKIRECVQTYARFPQTLRVFLAGGNDPQYISTFDTLQSEHLLGKIVMLDTGDLDTISIPFPSLRLDNIFMNHKLQQIVQKPPLSSVSCVTTNNGLISPQSPASNISLRPIDPSLPLHKQNPPPCNEHYLMSCSKARAACKYSHEYLLTADQLASLSVSAKKAPCNWLKNGLRCPYGDSCCWGHFCPNGPKCFHLSKGKCWFKGEAMHPPLPSERDI
ncbi:hypothetical protein C8R44DRAFT_820940 [Mycena epipterygia]|nr:hypothetical protein C8R44DRAFT_820940 [Mycena epipterygia]